MNRSFPGISISPDVRFGKPCVAGTRVTAAEVLHWLAIGMSIEEIVDGKFVTQNSSADRGSVSLRTSHV